MHVRNVSPYTKQGSDSQASSVRAGERYHGTEDVRSSVTQSEEGHALSTGSS